MIKKSATQLESLLEYKEIVSIIITWVYGIVVNIM